jgi:hypothetical protein
MLALAKTQNSNNIKRLESRIYRCPLCRGAYHLTSETNDPK